ncbi:MAG: pantetheine-phosphate adenylyltransferase [Myxococcales bacterium]|nr:pantetheine-phosphate adenylyltransferase [Myxococcales bacterium]
MTVAIYPGSFDPLTNGHLEILRSGLVAFERIVVAVVSNPRKQGLFSSEERVAMIRESIGDDPRVEVDAFDGLLMDYCRRKGVRVVLRGLRAVADFEYELQMANMNRHLYPEVETCFIMAHDAFFYVSSSLVKEVARLGGDVRALVPPAVARRLAAKLSSSGTS